ncbi:MAG TPA: helix-turn-helix domain-containing protein [Candidatus Nanopelagicales bacterium]
MADSRDVQAAVDALSEELGCPTLIEDPDHKPLWWSAQDAVDEVRRRTILQRTVAPEAMAVTRRLRLSQATEPLRTPDMPEIGMGERWCVPLRAGRDLLGYLWVSDPDHRVGEEQLPLLEECARIAVTVLHLTRVSAKDLERRRAALVDRLLRSHDESAASELIELERLPHDVAVVVRDPAGAYGWALPGGMSAEAWTSTARPAASGRPVPLVDLGEAARRARCVGRALTAGARLPGPTWDDLGAWRLVVDAPQDLDSADVHPGAAVLADLPRHDLLDTARAVLDHGGDVTTAATALHVHRTTLYYRLDRIKDLIGVDLRTGQERTELHLALWLDSYRRTGTPPST